MVVEREFGPSMASTVEQHPKEGDSMFIPGETPHNETATSDKFELIEVSVPAEMGTSPCEAPG